MEIMTVLGYLVAIIIGVVLGLIGGGGSILTVPAFVYLFGVNPVTATAYSLFVVGITALVGTFRNIPKKQVDFRTGIVFAIPAFITVYLSRKFLVPAIPETIIAVDGFQLTKGIGIMLLFALIMLLAAISMIRDKRGKVKKEVKEQVEFNYSLIIIEGVVVGLLTGIVGAGGGFLIIPALVLLAKLPMKRAVATSLMIIAIKSLIGFIGDVQNMRIEWNFLLLFTILSVIGIFIGIYLNKFIDGKKLKKAFGWFVLIMAIYIAYKEFTL